jgi:hypothetical protein
MRRWIEVMEPRNDEPFDRTPWRKLLGTDSGAPTRDMDQRILAEARRALTPRVARWWLPASLAASLLLAILIVQWQLAEIGTHEHLTESDVVTAPATVAAGQEAPAAVMELPAQRQDGMPAPPANVAPPLVDRPGLESSAAPITEAPAREQSSDTGPPAAAAAAAPARKETSRALGNFSVTTEPVTKLRSPEEWYAEIEALRAAGHIEEANAELARFRSAYPDWRPPGLQQYQ